MRPISANNCRGQTVVGARGKKSLRSYPSVLAALFAATDSLRRNIADKATTLTRSFENLLCFQYLAARQSHPRGIRAIHRFEEFKRFVAQTQEFKSN